MPKRTFRAAAAASMLAWPWACVALLAGCGGGDDIPARLPTFPVTGEVFVDGEPAVEAFVYLNPRGADAPRVRPYAQIDKDGKFSISTYLSSDGAPAGEYVITVEWLTYHALGNQWGGPDKLQGRYAKAAESKFPITVEKLPCRAPRMDLTGK